MTGIRCSIGCTKPDGEVFILLDTRRSDLFVRINATYVEEIQDKLRETLIYQMTSRKDLKKQMNSNKKRDELKLYS